MCYPLHHWPHTCFCYFYAQWLLSTLWLHSIQFPQFTIFPITRLGTILLCPFSLQTQSLTSFSKPASPASWAILPHSWPCFLGLMAPCTKHLVPGVIHTALQSHSVMPLLWTLVMITLISSYLALTSLTKSHLFSLGYLWLVYIVDDAFKHTSSGSPSPESQGEDTESHAFHWKYIQGPFQLCNICCFNAKMPPPHIWPDARNFAVSFCRNHSH